MINIHIALGKSKKQITVVAGLCIAEIRSDCEKLFDRLFRLKSVTRIFIIRRKLHK